MHERGSSWQGGTRHLRGCARVTPTRLALLAATAGITALLIVGLLELGGSSGGQPSTAHARRDAGLA